MEFLGVDRSINCLKCGEPGVCLYKFRDKVRAGRVCPACFLKGLDELMVRSEIESGEYSSSEDGVRDETPLPDTIYLN